MLRARIKWRDVRKPKPLLNEINRLNGRRGPGKHGTMREQTRKSCGDDPWDADAFRSVHQLLPPTPRRNMERRGLIVSVDQQIHVGDDQTESRDVNDSASNSSLS